MPTNNNGKRKMKAKTTTRVGGAKVHKYKSVRPSTSSDSGVTRTKSKRVEGKNKTTHKVVSRSTPGTANSPSGPQKKRTVVRNRSVTPSGTHTYKKVTKRSGATVTRQKTVKRKRK